MDNWIIKKRKMVRCTSSNKQQKREEHMKDGISGLPDEILIAILSLLTLKEAACTSILSRRWRYLWRYITASLNFDSKTLLAPAYYDSYLYQAGPIDYDALASKDEENRTKYVSCVNEVLKFHLGSYIDEMRISFEFRGHYPCDIDDWIKFAMEKGVQRFELDLLAGIQPGPWMQLYDFPNMENFKFSSITSHRHHVPRTIGSAAGFYSLAVLRLLGVNIMDGVIENFVSNCPFLEQLCIVGTTYLVNIKIAGPSLKLKSLEISHCHSLENLEISAMNLVSFSYSGRDISVAFKNVPLLSEVSIRGEFCSSFVFGSCKHSSYIPQIEKLKLQAFDEDFLQFPKYFRELGNLKQVELYILGFIGCSLLSLTSVIKASPKLSKFSLRMILAENGEQVIRDGQIAAEKEATKCHHQCLKVVELIGFVGTSREIDLVMHILEVAPSLEKLIIDPRPVLYIVGHPGDVRRMETGKERALQLKTRLPATVKLVIL
ncbi:putative F-box/FBD/LRR-repeat protein At5g62970 [Cornus florida]|uniref:putative F-box/FBD/LRR-repeat protein At5g62970 n=1 Tax=Cornus florida TaxID=4283 RepID=UPI00289CD57C|nr:putative F-box/FBD/LRR-repeat protein At5g62970 [Cornus florida]XP_059662628.1 putative F-box/FBD/LRR-repeat protein At5g62970 [Cornus florida]XP_059662636.1 putative F-box/FBD/LRR-repeat protein At5g62970 [Cornus florida]XP_059662643.1 putative F-box/FBD/LRR-repeat protein At5g62970 [Cornus florida]